MAGRTWHSWAARTVALAGLCALALLLSAAGSARADAPRILGVNLEGAPHNAAAIDDYTRQVGAAPGIVMWYQAWSEPAFTTGDADNVRARGATPLITWMPQLGSTGIKLADIALGHYDQYVLASARQAAAYKFPLMFRFAHEMNLKTSPWGPGVNGNTPADYINAWRHVVQIFRVSGATNVQWVWSPNVDYGQAPFTQFYPGDAWVDWVALDGYNWGPTMTSGWKELGDVFGPSYDTLTRLTTKPLMIAETASTETGGNKAQWILNGFQQAIPQRLPRVRAIVWFSRNKETDWRVNSSPASLLAYRQIAGSAAYAATTPVSSIAAPPAPAASADGPPTPVASHSQAVSRLAVRGDNLRAVARRVAVRIACLRAPGPRCTGTVALATTGRGRTLLGIGRFSTRAHHSAIAKVKLSRAGQRLLRAHHGRLSALVTVVADEPGALPVHRRLRLASGR